MSIKPLDVCAGSLVVAIGVAVYVWPPTPVAAADPIPAQPVQVAPAQAPLPPPGWIMTRIPNINGGGYADATAASWCEGTTRVHTLNAGSQGGVAQDIERNAVTCGGTGTEQ